MANVTNGRKVFWEGATANFLIFSSYMIENQKETPQEKPKSTPTVIVIVIVAHSTSFSIRPKKCTFRILPRAPLKDGLFTLAVRAISRLFSTYDTTHGVNPKIVELILIKTF